MYTGSIPVLASNKIDGYRIIESRPKLRLNILVLFRCSQHHFLNASAPPPARF